MDTAVHLTPEHHTAPGAADKPKVEIKDPREGHRKLLPTYTDKDMHDVTAFLVTLK